MSESTSNIVYTFTDEAPALAMVPFLPIVDASSRLLAVVAWTN